MNISIVIPCHNEEKNIAEISNRFLKIFDKIDIDLYKIIFIDDGSTDNSWQEINLLSKKFKNKILGIRLSRNFGHQNAVMTGLKYCKSDLTLIIDADLQDPPELLEEMKNKLINEKANCVYGKRISRKDTFFKKITASIFYRVFNKLSYTKIPFDAGDFRLIDEKIVKNLLRLNEADPFIRGLVPWTGFKQIPIEYARDERRRGESSYNLKKMLNLTLEGMLSFSNFPLKISYYICIISLVILLLLVVYTLKSYFDGQTVQGWTSLIMTILFFNSILFFILAIFGEYLGRIFLEIKKRPNAIISEITED